MLFSRVLIGVISGLFLSGITHAQETAYLDDRSNPTTLIASYFNALNAHEYARAWSYGDHEGTDEIYEDMIDDLEKVQDIEIRLGDFNVEGAAGSVFTQIPLVMVQHLKNGNNLVFSGCLTTRMVNPEIQTRPFRPLNIWESKFNLVKAEYEAAEFEQCTE